MRIFWRCSIIVVVGFILLWCPTNSLRPKISHQFSEPISNDNGLNNNNKLSSMRMVRIWRTESFCTQKKLWIRFKDSSKITLFFSLWFSSFKSLASNQCKQITHTHQYYSCSVAKPWNKRNANKLITTIFHAVEKEMRHSVLWFYICEAGRMKNQSNDKAISKIHFAN